VNIVPYYRVSTVRQGNSGLGLEAQRVSVESYRKSVSGDVIHEFTEVESGKKSSRPKIREAIQLCKQTGATLVVAKLDRLARNVAFTSQLMESGVEFIACDCPSANRMTVHILAAVAENEALLISKRTKESLAAAKARGTTLGNPSSRLAAVKGNKSNVKAAADHAATVLPIAKAKRDAGWTLEQIAHHLTGKGYLTRYGKAWSTTAVLRLLAKAS
jgi:DNA invertase Pin-like site-specific DNA recombinase